MSIVGKTEEFATSVMNYYLSGGPLPVHTGVYIALLSGIPDGNEPYGSAFLSAMEVSAGNYRAQVDVSDWGSVSKDTATSAMSMTNSEGTIDFTSAPGDFNLSGYAICISDTATDGDTYLCYEIFTGDDGDKARAVQANDTIKVNTSNLTLKER